MNDIMAITEEKNRLREWMRGIRKEMSAAQRAQYDDAICENVLSSPAYQNAETVLLYAAMPWEVQTRRLSEHTLSCGKTLALPVCDTESHTMIFYRLEAMSELTVGAYRIPVPPVVKDRICVPDEKTLMLLPMLGYDRFGYRLGAGGGYYDRFLSQYPTIRTLGLCYAGCTVDTLPHDCYDQKMQACITENGTEEFHG